MTIFLKIRYYKIRLDYDKIDISKGSDPNKSNKNKECLICQYWIFNHGIKFQDSVCNGCQDLKMLCLDISNIAIITIKNVDYRCVTNNISKYQAINL